MQLYELKQVLWVEDDPNVIETYPLMAEQFDLELVHFPCWDDAKLTLENEFDRWSAIILDAKCKYHRDSADNAVEFLREALDDISTICEKKGRIIPWYVLTGGDSFEVSDSINDKRLKWDKDWTDSTNKKYYSKNMDNEMLYRRIRYHANISPRLQIQKMYKDVFSAMEELEIKDEAINYLEDLLIPIHFSNEVDASVYNKQYVVARSILECVFGSMCINGILPPWGRKINLQWSSCLLSGMDAKEGDKIVIRSNNTEGILPATLKRIMRELINIIPSFCHIDNANKDEAIKANYLSLVGNSTFLLKSFTLQICELIIWYRNYIRDHSDKEMNSMNWEVLDKKALR